MNSNNKLTGILALFIFILVAAPVKNLNAQGCSDAGFCSAGNLQAFADGDSVRRSFVAIKTTHGAGEKGVTVFQIAPELEWVISNRHSVQASVPYVFTSGNLGEHHGLGDAILSYSYSKQLNEKAKLGLTAGFRIPTGTTDEEADYTVPSVVLALPMPYQTGLGTTDLILGTSLNFRNTSVALGYQMVLDNNNKNRYYDAGLGYFSSNLLERGDDALLRVGQTFSIKKLQLTPSALMIYRVNKDVITDLSGNKVELKGSDGLTFNLNLAAQIPLGKMFSIRLDAGAPLLVRDTRADGLTRSFAASLSVRYHF